MSFSANLQHLRATRRMTQEQLAMLLGVSRQAVSKWESDAAYPEMDKLLRLCDIFECSLDDLARGDLTHRIDKPALAVAEGPATDICDYDRHMRGRAATMAAGVACVFLGIAGFCGTGGIAIYGIETQYIMWPYVFLLAGLIPACALLLFARTAHASFTRRHPFIEDFYSEEDKARALTRRKTAWAAAVVLIAIGAAVCWFQTGPLQHLYGGLASLNITIACASLLVVYASTMAKRTDIDAYNRRLEEKAAWEDFEERRLRSLANESNASFAPRRTMPDNPAEESDYELPEQDAPTKAPPSPCAMPSQNAVCDEGRSAIADGCAETPLTARSTGLFRRVQEQRRAAAGIIMAVSAIVALVMLFALRSPNWMLALVIGALACVIEWIAMPFLSRSQR